MTTRHDLLTRESVIARVGCPYCLEDAGHACFSKFLGRHMTDEVHRERRAAAATAPVRR
jgi:hypothetical protein